MSRRRRFGQRGQAITEFALVGPLFILLLLATIEFGRAVYYVQVLDNAAREGARYAIVHGAKSQCPSGPMPNEATAPNRCDPQGIYVEQAVKDFAIAVIDAGPSDFAVTRKWCEATTTDCIGTAGRGDGDNERGQQVAIEVEYDFKTLLSAYLPLPDFTLEGKSTLVVNN
jgi:hypothetical protein